MNNKIDITPSCVLAMDLSNGYLNTTGTKKVFDHSQYHNHGTVIGALPRYPGFSFDGVNDYVSVSAISGLSTIQTVSMWAKSNFTAGMNEYLFSEGGNNCAIQFYDDADANILPKVAFNAIIGTAELTATNTWYHIVCIWNGDGTGAIYINGVLDATLSGTDPTPSDINIGRSTSGSGNFNGAIDEVRIYNVALTALEVKNHFELSRSRYGK